MEQPMFYTGQPVVCIDSTPTKNGFTVPLVEGKKYSILEIFICGCGHTFVDVGITNSYGAMFCKDCNKIINKPNWMFRQTRFIPQQFDEQADEAIHESLKGRKQEFLN